MFTSTDVLTQAVADWLDRLVGKTLFFFLCGLRVHLTSRLWHVASSIR